MKYLMILFFTTSIALACDRDYYLISDFDDTIKTYKSHGSVSFVLEAAFKKRMNAGFGALYSAMIEENSYGCDSERMFTVLTASPSILKGAIRSFFKKFDFPSFNLITKPFKEKTFSYKVSRLASEAERMMAPFILVGDDTSKDPDAYQAFKSEYPERVLQIYIHNVTNRSPLPGQIGYLTAFDIALNEFFQGRLSLQSVITVGSEILKSRDDEIIPPYGYCPTSFAMKEMGGEIEELWRKVATKIISICKERNAPRTE